MIRKGTEEAVSQKRVSVVTTCDIPMRGSLHSTSPSPSSSPARQPTARPYFACLDLALFTDNYHELINPSWAAQVRPVVSVNNDKPVLTVFYLDSPYYDTSSSVWSCAHRMAFSLFRAYGGWTTVHNGLLRAYTCVLTQTS
jgi:hypothetical protein